MGSDATLVERLRPLLADRAIGVQLFVIALLESRSAERYREWAQQVGDPALARGLQSCAEREDAIADRIRSRFAEVLEQPRDFAPLLGRVQAEVAALFGGHSREQQYQIQAQAERGGEQLWIDLAAAESDPATKQLLLECAGLEAGSAQFLEGLRGG